MYYLDANVFIEAHRRYYSFDFCPAFWDWIVENNTAGKVFSVQEIGRELARGNGELKEWAARRGREFFIPLETRVEPSLKQVREWAKETNYYTASATDKFLGSADLYLISQALADNRCVVTLEVPENTKARIKIPYVRKEFNIKCLSPFDMLRNESAWFVNARKP